MPIQRRRITLRGVTAWGGTLLSTALFALLIARMDWRTALHESATIALWALVLTGTLLLLGQFINTARWFILLRAQDVTITYWQAMKLAWSGVFASNFLPSTIGGDGVRIAGVYPYVGRKAIAIGSVVLDRLVNMAAMVCLLPAPFLVLGAPLRTLWSAAAVPPVGWRNRVSQRFPRIAGAYRTWASRPSALFWGFVVAWPSNLVPMAATYLVARQLGISIGYGQVIGVDTVIYFLSVLPISVNGYGLREAAYATLYASLGASLEQASALAIVTRLLAMLVTVPGALWLGRTVASAAECGLQ
jgi:uncharacterized membrane protein YbhN (UPF0104 family)